MIILNDKYYTGKERAKQIAQEISLSKGDTVKIHYSGMVKGVSIRFTKELYKELVRRGATPVFSADNPSLENKIYDDILF